MNFQAKLQQYKYGGQFWRLENTKQGMAVVFRRWTATTKLRLIHSEVKVPERRYKWDI